MNPISNQLLIAPNSKKPGFAEQAGLLSSDVKTFDFSEKSNVLR